MKYLIKSLALTLLFATSSVVLADPPPSNPVAGSSYVGHGFECFANVCQIQTFYYQYVVVNGSGYWRIVYVEIKTIPRGPQMQ
jgi:hypothetical protein